MIKLVGLLKRKSGMSREDFISHYEMRHVPFALRLAVMGHDFRRNYPRLEDPAEASQVLPEYDVITELWFANRKAYEEYASRIRLPNIKARLAHEEERCLDRAGCRTFIVDEFITEMSPASLHR